MHLNVLSKEQLELLPILTQFKREYYMVGGTAIALHLGHRESIDFDLFKKGNIRKKDLYGKLKSVNYKVSFSDFNQVNMIAHGVKITFFSFPYKVPVDCEINKFLKFPDLITLAAMKAFALGRRAKWKDYVDLYFIIKYRFSILEISQRAKEIFGDEFIEKQFLAQLGYFKGINYEEEVTYLIPNPPTEEEIQQFLTEVSISGLI